RKETALPQQPAQRVQQLLPGTVLEIPVRLSRRAVGEKPRQADLLIGPFQASEAPYIGAGRRDAFRRIDQLPREITVRSVEARQHVQELIVRKLSRRFGDAPARLAVA